jgi:hypothetical protein
MNDCCRVCGRRVPRTRPFCMIDTTNTGVADAVVCIRCMENSGHLHAMLVPGCPEPWHDLYDHAVMCRWKRVGA